MRLAMFHVPLVENPNVDNLLNVGARYSSWLRKFETSLKLLEKKISKRNAKLMELLLAIVV